MTAPRPAAPSAGYVALVLHAHLPFVRHPERAHQLEELWLFEAITETYLPLLNVMNGWVRDGVPFALTLSLSPTLSSMLADPLLQARYIDHLDRTIALAHQEMAKYGAKSPLHRLARWYRDRFEQARHDFIVTYRRDLVAALRALVPHGLEVIATAATHGYLPLMEPVRSAARAQVRAGIQHHVALFGAVPRGFWLPECGYHPGHDRLLTDEGVIYTIAETHGVTHGVPRPRYAVFAPVYTPAGLAVFGRDVESSRQVWSADEGYPGDYDYREFYRDAGHDLPWEEVAPFLPWNVRADTGLKYYRITGKGSDKELYDPERAEHKARVHAANFVFNREHQLRYLAAHMDRTPVVVAPYDAELFGHWWYEGPVFIDHVMRLIAANPALAAITPGAYLEQYPTNQVVRLAHSSWGEKGYSEVWLSGPNDWIYRHLHAAARRMEQLAQTYAQGADPLTERALNQAARELFLAQSSDWAFIMRAGTVVEYAVERTHRHLHRFFTLANQLAEGRLDEQLLAEWEGCDNLLPYVDYRVFLDGPCAPEGPVHAGARFGAFASAWS